MPPQPHLLSCWISLCRFFGIKPWDENTPLLTGYHRINLPTTLRRSTWVVIRCSSGWHQGARFWGIPFPKIAIQDTLLEYACHCRLFLSECQAGVPHDQQAYRGLLYHIKYVEQHNCYSEPFLLGVRHTCFRRARGSRDWGSWGRNPCSMVDSPCFGVVCPVFPRKLYSNASAHQFLFLRY